MGYFKRKSEMYRQRKRGAKKEAKAGAQWEKPVPTPGGVWQDEPAPDPGGV